MMRVHNHGGRCCGIKHIHNFPPHPENKVAALPLRGVHQGSAEEMTAPGKDYYPGPEPLETGQERFEKLLDYIDKKKSSHLVEVVLHHTIADSWKDVLSENGFRLVTEFTNSNTGHVLRVFHRVTHKGEVVKSKKKTIV